MMRLPQQYMGTITLRQVTGKIYEHEQQSYHDQSQDSQASEDL